MLVVGAGIVGIACAHYLSRAGHSVTVIDQGRVGGACSHGNCGHICASHVLPLTEPDNLRDGLKSLLNPRAPFRVKPQWRGAMLRWFWEFARRCNRRQMLAAGHQLKPLLESSMHEYRALVAEHPIEAQWQPGGLLYVLKSRRGMDRFAAQDALLREEFGIGARRLEGDELTGFDPALRDDLAGAFHYPDDAFLRPDALLANWSAWLAGDGVRFEENCKLRHVRSRGGRITGLVVDGGEMVADRYVFATGAWSGRLAVDLGCRIPIQPGKGYSITMSRPENCPRHAMVFTEHRIAATPFRDGLRLGSMMEFAGFDTTLPRRRIRQLVDAATPYLRQPVGAEVRETWFGWRPIAWDSLPIIGRVGSLDNAVLATGHHMLGMTMAAGTGKLVAEILGDRPPHIDPAPFSPGRFE